ncbi:MAG: thioredoxin family protein [Candidatus Hydrothermarchaeales archaeon]
MVNVKVLTMPGCAHCPEAKELVNRIKKDMPDLEVEIIDVSEHPEVALKYSLMSAPGIVINEELVYIGGVPKEEELRARLKKEAE